MVVNGDIEGDGATNISGINSVTALEFYGDGSNLTGITTAAEVNISDLQTDAEFPVPFASAASGGVGGYQYMAGLSYGASSGGGRRSYTGSGSRNNHVAGPPSPEPAPVPNQGSFGGDGFANGGQSGGGGGGGAGGQGGDAGNNAGGAGGVGAQNNYRTGSNVYYAGGGGGTGFSANGGTGGQGGGGDGGDTGGAGTANTGGGGGAGDADGPTNNGGAGGSGIIVIRYQA